MEVGKAQAPLLKSGESASAVDVESLRNVLAATFEKQLGLLQDTRLVHSHSDILLPPDLVTTCLTPITEQLKHSVNQTVDAYAEEKDALRDVVQRDLFGYECRRAVLSFFTEREARLSSSEALRADDVKHLFDLLDIVLVFELYGVIDAGLPLVIHDEILERLTIEECSLHFDYIESRIALLTRGLVPSKGKGLVLLRICNELIRRLSKPTRQHTIFAGRVLSLLSSVLPFGERSGVNFRGEFNVDNRTTFDAINDTEEEDEQGTSSSKVDEKEHENDDESRDEEKARPTREERKAAEMKARREKDAKLLLSSHDPRFYSMFWNSQKWFANPTLLQGEAQSSDHEGQDYFKIPPEATDPLPEGSDEKTFCLFRTSTRYILNVFGAVGRSERELAGGKGNGDAKDKTHLHHGKGLSSTTNVDELPDAGSDIRLAAANGTVKRQKTDAEASTDESYFPKYLTGRNLLEYELRDASFRRHILVQFLILFQYLLSFTPKHREQIDTWTNKALANAFKSTSFTLEEADERWIREVWREIVSMLHAIPPEGKTYTDTVLLILQREINWLRWKSNDCPTIDRAPLSSAQLDAYARTRKALLKPLRPYPHALGTAALSRLWEDGVRKPEPRLRTVENSEGMEVQIKTDGLDDLEMGPSIPTFEAYAAQIVRLEERADARRKELDWDLPKPYVVGGVASTAKMRNAERERTVREEKDATLAETEQKRSVAAWRAMRMARTMHLDCFAKMRCDLPDGGTTIGTRIDDVTRLTRAISDKENDIPALPTPAPAPAVTVSTPSGDTVKQEEDGKEEAGVQDDDKVQNKDKVEDKGPDVQDEGEQSALVEDKIKSPKENVAEDGDTKMGSEEIADQNTTIVAADEQGENGDVKMTSS